MSLVVTNAGQLDLLELLLKTALLVDETFHLHLYSNNYDPTKTSVLGDFTECMFSGYDVVELFRTDWQTPVQVGDYAQSLYGTTFVSWLALSGSQTCYGYFVTDESDAAVIWAELLQVPQTVTTATPILIWPLLRLKSDNPGP